MSDATFSSDSTTSSDERTEYAEKRRMNYIKTDIVIQQYAADVVDFSSQYGNDFSISYTAYNITGKPSKFPDYGDFPESYAMRTYGNWWDKAPSSVEEFMLQSKPQMKVHDFIVVQYEDFVFPQELHIFETYNPGAIVKIWAYCLDDKWQLLWEGLPQRLETRARKFSPPIRIISNPTKFIRLEFNHSKSEYFTEIDGVMLIGTKYCIDFGDHQALNGGRMKGPIQIKLESSNFQSMALSNQEEMIQDFLRTGLDKYIEEPVAEKPEEIVETDDECDVKILPYEILFKIFSFLDLKSLLNCSQVCKKFNEVSLDPLLYTEINLKFYWHCVTSEIIQNLCKRASLLKKLDLSRCGMFGMMNSNDMKDLLKVSRSNLIHLRLNSCKFLNASCLETIGAHCGNLKEISLRNYKSSSSRDFFYLTTLNNLERIDLFNTNIEIVSLMNLLRNNSKLKHLNLGFCSVAVNMDQIALQISKYNKNLVTLDMWKTHSLTSIGIRALSECTNLQEVDFGWSLREEPSPGDSLKILFKNCPYLKKIFLAAIRGLSDRDLQDIADYCPHLEQLDLMGILGITTEMCLKVLLKCRKLSLLDLSFCDQIDDQQVRLWRESFKCNIKRSFVAVDLYP